jgi:predicted secreted acid phosphatase
MRTVWTIVIGILRELADENAYQRHLVAHSRKHSPEEWKRFCDERLKMKYSRAKCC